MGAIHPRWSTWSFLVYAGGLTFAAAAAGWVSYLASKTGAAGDVLWVLLGFVALAAIAERFRRTDHPVTAGVFALGAVALFADFIAKLFSWFGWAAPAPHVVQGFHPAQLLLELLWIAAAAVALRRFRFPLLMVLLLLPIWLFVTDLVSNGGGWTAFVSIAIGLVFLAVALSVDSGENRPYGFWLHVGAGLAIGASVIWWLWHDDWFAWTLVALASVAYIVFARAAGRSSWAVLGAIGLFLACNYFVFRWTHVRVFSFDEGDQGSTRAWVPPLLFSLDGAILVALGLRSARPGA